MKRKKLKTFKRELKQQRRKPMATKPKQNDDDDDDDKVKQPEPQPADKPAVDPMGTPPDPPKPEDDKVA